MQKKTGSQVSKVLGVKVETVNGTISKRAAQTVLQHKLGITDRQARAAVSSYRAEGWLEPQGGINAPLAAVNSFQERVLTHTDAAGAARAKNGKLGGRPRK